MSDRCLPRSTTSVRSQRPAWRNPEPPVRDREAFPELGQASPEDGEAFPEDLFAGVTDDLDQELCNHWQGFLQLVAHRTRRSVLDHPTGFSVVATRHPSVPWLRPPLWSLESVSTFLATLTGHGFTDQQAVDTYRSFSSFLLGQLLLEVSTIGAATDPAEEPLDQVHVRISHDDDLNLSGFPHLQRLRILLSEDRAQEEFEICLEQLLDRIDRQVSG